MINRVLIRTKVVQLLYSYMLVENRFNLESQPANPTREKRFAYGLYLDILCLMARVAKNVKRISGDLPLYETRFMKSIVSDEKIKSLMQRYDSVGYPFELAQDAITQQVKDSALYKNFLKSDDPGSLADEKIWQEIYNMIIMPNPVLSREIARRENYTLSGVERMRGMMEETFSNFFTASDNLPDALNTLRKSMESAAELYFRLLYLPVQLVRMRENDIEEARNRFIASDEVRNPNLRFVENKFVEAIMHDEEIDRNIERIGRNMTADDEPMLRALLRAIMASDIYKEYMEFPATDFAADCEFWKEIYRQVIFINPVFLEALEDKSVFWNDDLDSIGTFVLKTVRRIAEGKSYTSIMTMYKDDEDARFGAELFEYVLKNKEDYRAYINDALDTKLWEYDRLAYMDIVVMMTALAEILNFPKIPLTVSINEYVEIAKAYSTRKSGQFIHGLLASILKSLHEKGVLQKSLD